MRYFLRRTLLFAILAISLTACRPAEPTGQGSRVNTTESTQEIQPSSTPEPTATTVPHYDIHVLSTWPQEMQDYWNGGNDLWSDPSKTPEFDAFIQQSRRDYLLENGIQQVAEMSAQDLFNEYIRLGQEYGGVLLTFTTTELRELNYGALNRYITHYAHSDTTSGNYIFYDGIYLGVVPGNGVMDLTLFNDSIARHGNFRNIINGLNVLGVTQNDLMPGYYGFVGDGAARFRLPGIDPGVAQGILGHIYLNDQDIWLPAIISFQDVPIRQGDLIVDANEIFHPINHDDFIRYSRVTLPYNPGRTDTPPITEPDVINLIGKKITFRSDSSLRSDTGVTAYFPFNLGLQGATADIHILDPIGDAAIYSGLSNWPWNRP